MMNAKSLAQGVALLAVAACTRGAPQAQPALEARTEASTGVTDLAFAKLLEESWHATMARHPTWASYLGDRRFDATLPDASPEAAQAWHARREGWLTTANQLAVNGDADRVTLALFQHGLQSGHAVDDACRFAQWSLSARDNPLTELAGLVEMTSLDSPQAADDLLKRYQAAPAWIAQLSTNLERGLAAGLVANRASLQRVIQQVETDLAAPRTERALAKPLMANVPGHSAEQSAAWRAELDTALVAVDAALTAYVALLSTQLVPAARGDEQPGLASLPLGKACYAALIRQQTTLPLDPVAVHQTGLDELKRLHRELEVLGARAFGVRDRAAIVARLREDPALRFSSEQEVEAKATEALARARQAIPKWFGLLPRAACEVARVPAHEAPYTTIAYYMQPAQDGSRPGRYYVNTFAPETRPRHEAEVLAYHESIPGHHLQIAIAQEQEALPAFRRHDGMTAMVEGWGLYAEQLADEMGLYSSDLDRIGANGFEQWRAARLVVDTGLHHYGWSRAQAEQFMVENTPLARNNIENEVDRYITTPGQALAYKVGQLEIWRLRRDAEARLGERFDIKGFHDAVLGGGAVTLPVLADRVEAWVVSVASNP